MKPINKLQKYALYILLFSINFEVWDPFNTSGFFSISKLMGFIYFFSILPNVQEFTKKRSLTYLLNSIWIFFFLVTIVSLLNVNSVSSTFFDSSIFQCIILFWFLMNHERKDPGILEKGLLSFAIGSIVLAILYIMGIGISYEGGRITIFGDNQNVVGLRMTLSIIILAFYVFQNTRIVGKNRFLLLLPLPIMLQLMVETGSRVAFITFAVSSMVGLLMFKTKHAWSKALSFLIGGGLLIGAWFVIAQSDVLMTRLIQSSKDQDLAGRGDIWETLLPLVKANPIFGVGESGYEMFIKQKLGEFRSPHNVFLEILCYSGIAGLIVYLIFLCKIVTTAVKNYMSNNNLIPILILFPILGLLLSGQILTSKIGWILYAYVGSLVFVYRKNLTNDNHRKLRN